MSKKISEFNKEELVAHLKASGEIHRGEKESKAWIRAFELYRQQQGGYADIDCSTCWSKVKEWIKG